MEALVPAFVATLLAQSSDRTPWLVAILVDRFRRPLVLFLAMLAALAVGNAVAAAAGALVTHLLSPQARSLMLALALLFAGVGALVPLRRPDPLAGWKIGGAATTFLGVLILAFGDAAQFLTFGIAARDGGAISVAIGATAGATVALLLPLILGEAAWRKLPLVAIRSAIAASFLLTAGVAALSAFRII